MAQVKRRSYDSSHRLQQAKATRAAILEAARSQFLREGVGATTISSVATDAGVSTDSVYKIFGGKPGLIRAITEEALAGEGPVPAERRSDALQASGADGPAIVRGFAEFTIELSPRVVPLLLMVRQAAAIDPSMGTVWEGLEAQRLRRMTHNARNLRRAGVLRRGLSVEHAGELMWVFTGPEIYERLVLKQGWSLRRYGDFISEQLAVALLAAGS